MKTRHAPFRNQQLLLAAGLHQGEAAERKTEKGERARAVDAPPAHPRCRIKWEMESKVLQWADHGRRQGIPFMLEAATLQPGLEAGSNPPEMFGTEGYAPPGSVRARNLPFSEDKKVGHITVSIIHFSWHPA